MPNSVRLAPRAQPLDLLCVFSLLSSHGQRRVLDQLVAEMAGRFGRNIDLTYRAKRQKSLVDGIRMVLEGYGVPERLDYLAQALNPEWLAEYRSPLPRVAEVFGTLGCIFSHRRMAWDSAQMVRAMFDARVPSGYKEVGRRIVEFVEESARNPMPEPERQEAADELRDSWGAFLGEQQFPRSGETGWFVDVITRLVTLVPGGSERGAAGRFNNWFGLIADLHSRGLTNSLWMDTLRARMWTIEPEPSLVSVDITLTSFEEEVPRPIQRASRRL